MTPDRTAPPKRKAAYTLSLLLLLLVGAAPLSAARAADDASGFIAGLGSHAIAIMQDTAISPAERQRRFRTLMAEDFDLPKIAQFVLGSYWPKTSDSERQQFTSTFGDFMAGIYSTRFAEYSAQSFRVTSQRVESEMTTVVSSEIVRAATGEELDLDWIVAKTPDSYKVTDITAGGMSLSRAQRDEFASVVHRNGDNVSNLIRQMQVRSTDLAAVAP
jgi:phospholipid transport system substrate-binding protein